MRLGNYFSLNLNWFYSLWSFLLKQTFFSLESLAKTAMDTDRPPQSLDLALRVQVKKSFLKNKIYKVRMREAKTKSQVNFNLTHSGLKDRNVLQSALRSFRWSFSPRSQVDMYRCPQPSGFLLAFLILLDSIPLGKRLGGLGRIPRVEL